jgi:hypothetical protein
VLAELKLPGAYVEMREELGDFHWGLRKVVVFACTA